MRAPQLLKAIGAGDLTRYFEFLDELRASGAVNMFGSRNNLMDEFDGMTKEEARVVALTWMDTFSETLPAEDRVNKALEA